MHNRYWHCRAMAMRRCGCVPAAWTTGAVPLALPVGLGDHRAMAILSDKWIRQQAQAEGMTNDDVVERLVREIPPPEIPKFEQK